MIFERVPSWLYLRWIRELNGQWSRGLCDIQQSFLFDLRAFWFKNVDIPLSDFKILPFLLRIIQILVLMIFSWYLLAFLFELHNELTRHVFLPLLHIFELILDRLRCHLGWHPPFKAGWKGLFRCGGVYCVIYCTEIARGSVTTLTGSNLA